MTVQDATHSTFAHIAGSSQKAHYTREDGFTLIAPFLSASTSAYTVERALRALCIHFRTPLHYWTLLHEARAKDLLIEWRLNPRSGSISSLYHHLSLPVSMTESDEETRWIRDSIQDSDLESLPREQSAWDEETWQRSVHNLFAPAVYKDAVHTHEPELWYEDSSDPDDPEAIPF